MSSSPTSSIRKPSSIDHVSSPASDPEKNGQAPQTPAAFAPTFPDGGARAWTVALGAAVINGCSFGYASSFGVYQAYYQRNQLADHTPSQIAWIGSLQLCFMFAGGFFSGPIFDRFGARPLMVPASILYALSVLLTSLCTEYWHFILCQGIFGGICNGLIFSPAMAVVGQYFNKKRGAAMGVVAVGSSIGGTLFPIALEQAFYSRVGFAWGTRAVGFVMLVLLLISCIAIKERFPHKKHFRVFAPEAFRNLNYLGIIMGVFFMFWGIFVILFFISDYAIVKVGMSTSMAFYLLAIVNGSSVIGRMAGGILGDKVGHVRMLAVVALMNAIMIFTWNSTSTGNGLIGWAVIFGITSGGTWSLFSAALIHSVPNPSDIGTWLGQAMIVFSIAGLTGSPLSGAIVGNYGFTSAGIFGGVALLVGSAFTAMAAWSSIKSKH